MLELARVLVRRHGAQTPHAYDGLPADAPWRLSGVWKDGAGTEHVLEIAFASEQDAESFAASELGLAGAWTDPDGDGNYCITG